MLRRVINKYGILLNSMSVAFTKLVIVLQSEMSTLYQWENKWGPPVCILQYINVFCSCVNIVDLKSTVCSYDSFVYSSACLIHVHAPKY